MASAEARWAASKDAQQLDIDDLQSKFGNKYDEAIQEMLDYTDELDLD